MRWIIKGNDRINKDTKGEGVINGHGNWNSRKLGKNTEKREERKNKGCKEEGKKQAG